MKKRITGIIIVLEWFLITIVPLLTFNWTQGKISSVENRILKTFPSFFDSEGKIQDDLPEEFDEWFKDNIGFRDQLITLSSVISFNLFHKSTSKEVEIGKEGWLFYTEGNNMDIVKGVYPHFNEPELHLFCEKLKLVQAKLKRQGREFIFILPPSKVSIYPEYIQSGDYGLMETPADTLANYLQAHSTIKVVRLKDALLDAKNESDHLLYFKTDTHWNYRGGYIGYKKIIEDMNSWGLIESKPIDAIFFEGGPYSGDLAKMMGPIWLNGEQFSEKTVDGIELKKNYVEEISSGERYDGFRNLMITEGFPCENEKEDEKYGSMWNNINDKHAPTLLVYGDSMIIHKIPNYIAANFSEASFLWSYYINQEMLDYLEPNIVALNFSERCLTAIFSPDLFDGFLEKIEIYKDNGNLDIFFHDEGVYAQMYVPVWNEHNGQDDLFWYKAERSDDRTWHVRLDLAYHGIGKYQIHFYVEQDGVRTIIDSTSYDVVKISE